MSLQLIMTLAILASTLLFGFAWWVCKRIDNYSLVDAVWATSFALFAPWIVLYSPGFPIRSFILAAMFMIWGLRLGIYLFRRILGHIHVEDSRYQELRRDYGQNVKLRFLLFFQYQALSVVFLILPLFIVAQNQDETLHPFEVFGVLIWLFGIIGESIADRQLANFKKKNSNPKEVCKAGLWRYSRHPNYFFECVLWLGYAVYAQASPHGWVAWLSSGGLWFLILKVTGIPYAEAQSLKRKGEAFIQYQRETNSFFPGPPRI